MRLPSLASLTATAAKCDGEAGDGGHGAKKKKNRPRCYAKSPTAQDMVRSVLGLISCPVVTDCGDGDYYLMHKVQSAW